MLGTIYVGLAGMNAYSRGLDIISNNVANLNTTGFKSSSGTFSDVVNRNSGGATRGSPGTGMSGAGVQVSDEELNLKQGDRQATSDQFDAAVFGNGFFVLERDGQRYYTRAGDFELKDGVLVEKRTGAKVMMSNSGSSMGELNVDAYRVSQPQATTEVKIAGNLARTGTESPSDLTIAVHDSSGNTTDVKLHLVRNGENPLLWAVSVLDKDNQTIGSGSLLFNADGTPAAENTAITVTVTPEGLPAFTFTLSFGTAGTYGGATSLVNNGNSALSLLKKDGRALGIAGTYLFDERGNLEITYTNTEKQKIGRLVLARVDSGADLTSIGDGLYVMKEGSSPRLSAAMEQGLGTVQGGNVELSNVVLTDEFTQLIIIQRGYQACSQMTSVANEMMQQLLAMQGGK